MNMMQLFASLLVEISRRQHWAESDKAGGAFHLLVPVAEGIVLHAAVASPSASGAAPVVTINQHPDINAAWAAIAAGLSTPTTPGTGA